jgi:hypothetical protein
MLLDLQSFRETLAALQRQVDDLDDLKISHYNDVLEHQEEVWNVVQNKVCQLVFEYQKVDAQTQADMPSDAVNDGSIRKIHRQDVRFIVLRTVTD